MSRRHAGFPGPALKHGASRDIQAGVMRPVRARLHPLEYAIEAGCLAAFMVSAAAFATLLQHPASPWMLRVSERSKPGRPTV